MLRVLRLYLKVAIFQPELQEHAPRATLVLKSCDCQAGAGGNRTRDRGIAKAGAQTTRQLRKTISRATKLHGATARALRHARSWHLAVCNLALCSLALCKLALCNLALCKLCNLALCNLALCNLALCNLTLCNLALCNFALCSLALCNLALCNLALCNLALRNLALCNLALCNLSKGSARKNPSRCFRKKKRARSQRPALKRKGRPKPPHGFFSKG